MTTIVCAPEYVKKIVDMRKNGMATFIKTLITMDEVDGEAVEEASQVGITVQSFTAVVEKGR